MDAVKSIGIAALVAFIAVSTFMELLRQRPAEASALLVGIVAVILAWLLLRDRRNRRIIQRQIAVWSRTNPRLATGIAISALALVIVLLLIAAHS